MSDTESCFFDALDAQKAQALELNHREMHGAIRDICAKAMANEPGNEQSLCTFETTQIQLIEYLSHFQSLLTQTNSQIDPLTGLPLRHRLEQKFELLKKRSNRQGGSVAIMMIDIDHFKSVNDQYGHIGGDLVLKEIAKCLKNSIREGDEAYRYGGDELLVLLELRSSSEAILAGQRLLNTIRRQSVVLIITKQRSKPRPLSASPKHEAQKNSATFYGGPMPRSTKARHAAAIAMLWRQMATTITPVIDWPAKRLQFQQITKQLAHSATVEIRGTAISAKCSCLKQRLFAGQNGSMHQAAAIERIR